MSSIDRLSGLPDDVVCHILSFLPTKVSASTDCLAKRWRFLWTHVPNLDFKRSDFKDKRDSDTIIHRVMLLHQAKTMNTLSLNDVNCTEYQLAACITHAINRRVRNLSIYFIEEDQDYIYFIEEDQDHIDSRALFTLPRCVLTCETLVDVKLYCCRGIPSSCKVFLPSLKKLHLSRIEYEDDESLPRLLSGCPVLENLIVDGCYKEKLNDDLDCVFVSSPTIKFLNVDLSCGCPVLKINAPSLGYLNVKSFSLEDITILRNMTSLIEASVSLLGECDDYEEGIDYYTKYAQQFLNRICNLKCLKIATDICLDKLINLVELDSVVKFDNLTELEFDLIFDWHELVKFLELAKNLEVFTFILSGKYYTYREPKLVPTCMLSRLKTVRIDRYYGRKFNEHDFETVRYLLRNARVLERMEMCSYYCSDKERLEVFRRISSLERGSESCQLVFY